MSGTTPEPPAATGAPSVPAPAAAPRATGIAWATIQDVEDLIGPVEDSERCQRLLERSTALVASYIAWPLEPMDPEAVPPQVREAIATMTSRALTGATGAGTVTGETMGGYNYKMADTGSAADALRITEDIEELLKPYGTWRGNASVSVCGPPSCDPYWTNQEGAPPGAWYRDPGPKRDGYYRYLTGPSSAPLTNDPLFNSDRPGRWLREDLATNYHTWTMRAV